MSSGGSVEPIDMIRAIVCDAGPLIHLDEIDCLDLLEDFDTALVPDQVWLEVMRHRPQALECERINLLCRDVEIPAEGRFPSIIRAFSLDLGEQAALTLAQDDPKSVLLTDDAAARLAAKALGVRSHGTIGILLRAVRRGQRSKVETIELLRQLPQLSTLHIRHQLLLEIIAQLEASRGRLAGPDHPPRHRRRLGC